MGRGVPGWRLEEGSNHANQDIRVSGRRISLATGSRKRHRRKKTEKGTRGEEQARNKEIDVSHQGEGGLRIKKSNQKRRKNSP